MSFKKNIFFLSIVLIICNSNLAYQSQEYVELIQSHLHNQDYTRAIVLCQQARSHFPKDLQLHYQEAFALQKSGNIAKASEEFQNICQEYPWCTQALYSYAHTLKDLGFMEKAIENYNNVISHEPENNFAHFGLSQCHLALRNYQEGWPLFEFRSKDIKLFAQDIQHIKKRINNNSLKKFRILMRCEWGIGDMIQFVRFSQQLKQRGAYIIMQAPSEVVPLFSTCPYLDQIIGVGDAFPPHDAQIPLLSLPHLLDITELHITCNQPYLIPDQTLVENWHTRIAAPAKLKIGICWQGNGDKNAPPLLNKNIPLKELAPLTNIPNIACYCLQKIEQTEINRIKKHLPNLIIFESDFDASQGAFMDTAALMQSLDLIITIDTSIAHLAGALQRPVWLMLPSRCDWRWGINETSTNWYPTMKIFRQSNPGDWQSLIQTIIGALSTYEKP